MPYTMTAQKRGQPHSCPHFAFSPISAAATAVVAASAATSAIVAAARHKDDEDKDDDPEEVVISEVHSISPLWFI